MLIVAAAAPVFSTGHIALTAAIAGVPSLPIVQWRLRPISIAQSVLLACVVAASVFVWRLSANMPQLNDDGMPGFSANDWLCPIITYVALGLYAAVRPPADPARWGQTRALVTLTALIVKFSRHRPVRHRNNRAATPSRHDDGDEDEESTAGGRPASCPREARRMRRQEHATGAPESATSARPGRQRRRAADRSAPASGHGTDAADTGGHGSADHGHRRAPGSSVLSRHIASCTPMLAVHGMHSGRAISVGSAFLVAPLKDGLLYYHKTSIVGAASPCPMFPVSPS
jgi:hypothetical protein